MRLALFIGRGGIASQILPLLNEFSDSYLIFSRTSPPNIAKDRHISIDFHVPATYQNSLQTFQPDVVLSSLWCHRNSHYVSAEENFLYSKSTINLFKFSKCIGITHFVGIGSSAEHVLRRKDPYAVSKRETLNEIKGLSSDYIWLRPFSVYGRCQPEFSLIERIKYSIQNQKPFTLTSPSQIHDWITTRDVARAVLVACSRQLLGEHDVASGQVYSVKDFILFAEELLQVNKLAVSLNFYEDYYEQFFIGANFTTKLHEIWKAQDDIRSGIRWALNK